MYNDDMCYLENESAGFSFYGSQTSLVSPADGKEYADTVFS